MLPLSSYGDVLFDFFLADQGIIPYRKNIDPNSHLSRLWNMV